MRRASSWSGCLYTAFSYADLTMWRRNPSNDALERILKELKTRIKAEKKQVKSEPDGRWAFAAVQEAFQRRVDLDRVCSDTSTRYQAKPPSRADIDGGNSSSC